MTPRAQRPTAPPPVGDAHGGEADGRVLSATPDQAEQEVVLVVLEQVDVEEHDVEPARTTSDASE